MTLAITGERTLKLEEAIKDFAKKNNRTASDVLMVAAARYIKFDLATLPEAKRSSKRMPKASDIQKALAAGNIEEAQKMLKVMENIERERKEKAARKASAVTTTAAAVAESTTEEVKTDVESVESVTA